MKEKTLDEIIDKIIANKDRKKENKSTDNMRKSEEALRKVFEESKEFEKKMGK